MEAFKVCNLTFRYPKSDENVLDGVSFSVKKGEFITLCGPSGCGKSTLLRHLKPCLAPNGEKSGEIFFENKDIAEFSNRELSQKIGFVMQSPDNQIVTDKVWHELAFGLESLGLDNSTIRKRVAETASFFGLEPVFYKSVSELSGGQKQILNLASIMAMQPDVLILDEPASQLDPIAASEFLSCVSKINKELGTTVIITEHRLDGVFHLSDKILVIENGTVVSFDTPQNTGKNLKRIKSKTFLSLPSQMQIWDRVSDGESDCPVTVAQGRMWIENYAENNHLYPLYDEQIPKHGENIAAEFKEVWFRYEKDSADILKGLTFKVYEGEFAAILGGNGAGKSTALSVINGINVPYRGEVSIFGKSICGDNKAFLHGVATLPQNPQSIFVKKTVAEDLEDVFVGSKTSADEKRKLIDSVVSLCRLEKLMNMHPYDLSGGEQQRAALAKVLLTRPKILLLDEPTKGLDSEFKIVFAGIMQTLSQSGITVIMVSHDVEFCAKYAHRCMMFFGDNITFEDTPRNFFASNSFYSTSANRISRGVIKNAVTDDEVVYCLTGEKTEPPSIKSDADIFDYSVESYTETEKNTPAKLPLWKKILGLFSALMLLFSLAVNLDYLSFLSSKDLPFWLDCAIIIIPIALLWVSFGSMSNSSQHKAFSGKRRKIPKRTSAAAVMILLLIPLTIFVGVTYLQDKKYLFISLLVMLECMLPFFLVFEGRKPQARELVIIAVLCAIAVAGRTAFYFVPQFKPVIAIVIISGIALGAESGFLVGSLTMLLSNIVFQQGPWTPWQMFAAGIIGFLAGILFNRGLLSRSRVPLCIFGFIATVVIYGVIMNTSSAVISHTQMNPETITAFLALGFPFDLVHGIATALFLFIGAEPMLEKLDRVKTKYGLLDN